LSQKRKNMLSVETDDLHATKKSKERLARAEKTQRVQVECKKKKKTKKCQGNNGG